MAKKGVKKEAENRPNNGLILGQEESGMQQAYIMVSRDWVQSMIFHAINALHAMYLAAQT